MKLALIDQQLKINLKSKSSQFKIVYLNQGIAFKNGAKLLTTTEINSYPYDFKKFNLLVMPKILVVNLEQKHLNQLSSFKAITHQVLTQIKNLSLIKVDLIIEAEIAACFKLNMARFVEELTIELYHAFYNFDTLKNEKNSFKLKEINLIVDDKMGHAISNATHIANGLNLTKELVNLPSNHVTPQYLAEIATAISKLSPLVKISVLEKKELEQLNMGAFLAVTQGTAESPKFIILEYKASDEAPVILVGKGITFDSGGLSLKSSLAMADMKQDMGGAASVLGVFMTAVNLKLKINLILLIPSCENMPSGTATKPGDIVSSMSGITIEIANTDAEGRLILCDALNYAKRYQPKYVIDVATLTGACVIALGNVASGFYTNDESLAQQFNNSAQITDDKIWRMPLYDEYNLQLKSPVADVINTAGASGKAGSVAAACFLQKFTAYPWAHLDIAGTVTDDNKLATGRPVRLLVEFLRNLSNDSIVKNDDNIN